MLCIVVLSKEYYLRSSDYRYLIRFLCSKLNKKLLFYKRGELKMKVIPCEVYSRIVGYYRPVRQWNEGKQKEYKERKEFVITK